jgi:hypothetical protein
VCEPGHGRAFAADDSGFATADYYYCWEPTAIDFAVFAAIDYFDCCVETHSRFCH